MMRSLVAQDKDSESQVIIRRNLDKTQLEQALQSACMLWIDIVDPQESEIEWLAQQFDLNPVVAQDLLRLDRRPAMIVYPSYLFISLFEPQIRLSRVEGKEIHCIVTDKCFITVRDSNAETVQAAYDRVAQNPDAWESGVAYFLYLTAQYVIDAYYPLLDRVSYQLNVLEESLLNNGEAKDKNARRPVYRIKQQLIALRQMVAPQREVFSSVIGERRVAENSNTRDLFRHLYERLLRVYDVIDSQRDLSSNVLDMMQNQESQRLVEAVNRLTIFSMIFLPLTFFTGLFQLNFTTTPEPMVIPVSGTVLFMSITTAMILSAGLMIYFLRRRGWL